MTALYRLTPATAVKVVHKGGGDSCPHLFMFSLRLLQGIFCVSLLRVYQLLLETALVNVIALVQPREEKQQVAVT